MPFLHNFWYFCFWTLVVPISKQARWWFQKGKVFTIFSLFVRVAGQTAKLLSTKLPFWASGAPYPRPERSKWDTAKSNWNKVWVHPPHPPHLEYVFGGFDLETCKSINNLPDLDNAGKGGGRVQLHQDGLEDVIKDLFHGQFAPRIQGIIQSNR